MAVENECAVYGTLGFVLRLSKLYGIACLKFESMSDGWRIQASPAASLYSKTLILIIFITVTASVSWDFHQEISFHSRKHTDGLMTILTVAVATSVLFAEAYSGKDRMRAVVSCMAQTQKMNAELAQYVLPSSSEKIKLYLAVWSLVFGHIIVFTDYGILFYEIVIRNGDYLMEGLFVAYYMEIIMMKVLMLQIFLIFMEALSTFSHLNECLNNLLHQIRDQCPMNGTASSTLRRFGLLYCRIRELVEQLDECHGVLMVPLVTTFIVHLVITPYNFVSRLFGNNADFCKALLQAWWMIYHVVDMIILIEPCQRTHSQMNHTKYLLSELMHATPRSHHALTSELVSFYEQVTEKEVGYSPLGMFTVRRRLIATILGSVITYVVVMIQLNMKKT